MKKLKLKVYDLKKVLGVYSNSKQPKNKECLIKSLIKLCDDFVINGDKNVSIHLNGDKSCKVLCVISKEDFINSLQENLGLITDILDFLSRWSWEYNNGYIDPFEDYLMNFYYVD